MKKTQKPGNLNSFGIGILIVLGIIMMVHVYLEMDGEPIYRRLLEGALRFGVTFLGSGLIMLIFFLAIYAAASIKKYIFNKDEENDGDSLKLFPKMSNDFLIISYIVSYVIIFLGL